MTRWILVAVLSAACNDAVQPLATAQPGVVFTYPADAQVDVPTGAHIVVAFSDPVEASALAMCGGSATAPTGGVCLVGPNGVVAATAKVVGDDKKALEIDTTLDAGASYALFVDGAIAPTATNLPASGTPLVHFTTRSTQPKSAPPALIAVNGGDPMSPESFRPMLESTTIELLFSEPLDTRSVALAAGQIEFLDSLNQPVPATLLADGIHVAIDPKTDLSAGKMYILKLGNKLVDRSGQPLAPTLVTLMPHDSRAGNPPIAQTLKTRQMGDPGSTVSRTGLPPNTVSISKPLIGSQTANVLASELATEMGDPKVLGGPIAFTIRKGARLRNSGLEVKLGGQIPIGLQTGEIEIELLTDGGGRLFRNPHQPAEQRPENERAPLYMDLSMDIAIYAVDPQGNAVLSQTILGLTGVGVVSATDGVLDVETVTSLDLGLLGVTAAPTNLVLELITETTTSSLAADTTPPTLVSSYPSQNQHDLATDAGVDLLFSEPIDLDRARAGGLQLQTGAGAAVPFVLESHGAAVVLRPVTRLARGAYKVVFSDVADVAGNPATALNPLNFSTAALASTGTPAAITGAHPGVGCALTGGTATSPGRCVDGAGGDDLYHPFTLASDEPAEVTFDQPIVPTSFTLGTACGSGSVRFEEVNAAGTCTAAVKGSLVVHEREFQFIPDVPWVAGKTYKMTLVTGGNANCDANEICGSSETASFDILHGMNGNGEAGGPDLVIPFTGAAPIGATYLMATTAPTTDLNGSSSVDGSEATEDSNRTAMHVSGTTGAVSSAKFTSGQCMGGQQDDGCMYINGSMATELLPIQMGCTLPDGTMVPVCQPVAIAPGVMYGTSVGMDAVALFTLSTSTETSIMRVREPASGPITGYVYDDNGTPKMMVKLDLYMDAPDMSITLSSHDLHSKPISLALKGPVSFTPDGRMSIAVANVATVPIAINLTTTGFISSTVSLTLPAGQMKLQLLSAPLRGALP
ncbi:MAG TPA: Ig-like domain-containing protein [Kofleriaceae bacterium]|nr:Ig-like domain-containing protein [Kofleriaceae bacterium]